MIASALGLAVLTGMCLAARLVSPAFFIYSDDINIWFQADLPRIFANISDPESSHLRSNVHPLFSPIGLGLVWLTRTVLKLSAVSAVRLVVAAMAAVWVVGLFVVLRLVGGRRGDSLLFGGLAALSAAALFWNLVPETYAFGAASLIPMIVVAALQHTRAVSPWWYAGASALTLSITVTNWMTGLAAAFASQPWKKAARITGAAFVIVLVLSMLQGLVLRNVGFMLNWAHEARYAFPHDGAGLPRMVMSFVFHTLVIPEIQIAPRVGRPGFELGTQPSLPGSASWFGVLGVALWAILLSIGLRALFTLKGHRPLRLTLGVTLLGQLTLHALYGGETFLYSLHWAGPLVLVAGLGCLTAARPVTLGLAAGLLVCLAVNNPPQLVEATRSLARHGSPRQIARYEAQRRPAAPWPRGQGHVVLGEPGSRAEAKGYHEPAGSFSPGVKTFGVALWVLDAGGRVRATSDSVPLSSVNQGFVWSAETGTPAIESATPSYRARWTSVRPGQWRLEVEPRITGDERLFVVIGSVGPAGGAVRELSWAGHLLINGTWDVQADPPPRAVQLGDERTLDGPAGHSSARRWQGDEGWGQARIELPGERRTHLLFTDRSSPPEAPPSRWGIRPGLKVVLPDERFAASLEAQAAHLAMGMVDRQTRPGDPYHFPSAWLRDGAYVVVALARLGRLDLAQSLADDFAQRDFFGGFGSEADSPGLALWALGEVAARVRNAEYDRSLWPHVQRKAELIETMLSSTRPVRQVPTDNVLPELRGNPYLGLVAAPARDGLIVGRVELEFPLLYVNAVSYQGLRSAAAIAGRLGHAEPARRWRLRSDQQAEAWRAAFAALATQSAWQVRTTELRRATRAALEPQAPDAAWGVRLDALREDLKRSFRQPLELENEHTYAFSLWPAGMGGADPRLLRDALDRVWRDTRDSQGGFLRTPRWPARAIAQAHQWLLLGDPERAWATVGWFFDHQASPGLYTWWDGVGEENTYHQWDHVRGWLDPPHVTPAYRAAAEMLLMQLDMLAHLDLADGGTLVIGAGIPAQWSRQPMHVRGVALPGGRVDWSWDGREMRVTIAGTRPAVRLGPAFRDNATVVVDYQGPE